MSAESLPLTAPPAARFARQRAVALRTRKRDGSWVATPVSIAVVGERAYVRTYDAAGKAKRLRNFPEVELAPSTLRGRVTGPWFTARARLLEGEEARAAARALARKHPVLHGVLVPLVHRAKGWHTLHYELEDLRER
jgi:PPOX class probable F420-dependent enzyme